MLSKRLTLIWAHVGLTRGQLEATLPPGSQEKGVIRRHVEKGFLPSTGMTRTSSSAGGWVLSRQMSESCLLPGWMGFWTRGRNRGGYGSCLTG